MSPRPDPPEVDRVAASRAAVAARRARAAVKSDIATRTRTALDAAQVGWRDPQAAEASLRVSELLASVPTLGPTRTAKVMGELGISDKKRVGGLGIRQREKLRAYLVSRQGAEPSRLVVLAGPTAVGKGTVSAYIRDNYPEVQLSVSATTRSPRPGEIDGVHYYFVSDREFDRKVEAGELLEWATVHNSFRYGTPRPPIDAALAEGKRVLLEIDLQGARSVRRVMPEALLVFLLPPSWEELVRRLIGRGTEDAAEQSRRLETAKVELAAQDEFDAKVVNHEVGQAAREVVELMDAPAGATTSQLRSTMVDKHSGIIDPPIDELLSKVDSKYQLVIFASKRARQINDYYADLHEGSLFDNVGPLVDSTIDDKPLSVALHEINEDKLELKRLSSE